MFLLEGIKIHEETQNISNQGSGLFSLNYSMNVCSAAMLMHVLFENYSFRLISATTHEPPVPLGGIPTRSLARE